jgi:chromosome segregation ATPase
VRFTGITLSLLVLSGCQGTSNELTEIRSVNNALSEESAALRAKLDRAAARLDALESKWTDFEKRYSSNTERQLRQNANSASESAERIGEHAKSTEKTVAEIERLAIEAKRLCRLCEEYEQTSHDETAVASLQATVAKMDRFLRLIKPTALKQPTSYIPGVAATLRAYESFEERPEE